MHQNVCRMNCANVLSTKLSKKWILLQFKSLKLKNYLHLFVMEDPVHGFFLKLQSSNLTTSHISPKDIKYFEN